MTRLTTDDLLAQEVARSKVCTPCRFNELLEQLDENLRADVLGWLARDQRTLGHEAIARAISRFQAEYELPFPTKVVGSTIRRHRPTPQTGGCVACQNP